MITIWVPKRLVEIDLYNVAACSPQQLAQLSEHSYAQRVNYAAEKIRLSGAKIVMLTGPSASGKTTSAHCIARALQQQGTPAQVISLDNFFKGAEFYPRLPDGTLDYENPDTLDLPLIKQCLRELSETVDKVIAINLTGVYTAISAVYPSMKANGYGRIVNVASVAAKRGGGLLGTSAYAASKAGVIGLTKAVAREGAPYGVACNGVCPSLTMTPMTANMGEEKTKKIIATIPLGRGAQPREIANMVLFYASDLASFATGEISDVDGGVTMDG